VGQADAQARYLARSSGGTLAFTLSGVVLTFPAPGDTKPRPAGGAPLLGKDKESTELSRLRLEFVGSSPSASIGAGAALPGKVNYLKGKDPAWWHTGVPTSSGITYSGLYPGVDLSYSGNDGQLKGTYTLAPGADPDAIRWRYSGAQSVTVDQAGDLQITLDNSKLKTQNSKLTERAPQTWQEIGGQRVVVSSRYAIQADGSIGFQLGAYDRSRALTIDPTITYSTYLGGFYGDSASSIALDPQGNIYIAGSTISSDFPIAGSPVQPNWGGQYDAFVSKVSADGSTLVYSSYLGGDGEIDGGDFGSFVSVDASGNAIVAGYTDAADFPTTPGAYQTTFEPNDDLFISKLNPTGSGFVFSTYYGGGVLEPGGFTVDAAGNIYFTGYAYWGPTVDRWVFVGALDSSGSRAFVDRLLGGRFPGPGDENADSGGRGIALDAQGNIYVTGYTRAADFPTTPGAYRTVLQRYEDGFMTKLNPTGQTILYSTFIPGGSSDYPSDVAVNATGNAFVTGWTGSSDYPTTPGAFLRTRGDPTMAFVTKFNPTLSDLVYSTYLGDSQFHFSTVDYPAVIRLNAAGNAYVVGYTNSAGFPLMNPLQATMHGPSDGFITKFNPAGSALEFSTFLGGSSGEVVSDLVLTSNEDLYIAGGTSSADFPMVNPVQSSNHGGADAFIAIISQAPPTSPTATRTGTPPTATPTACVPGPGAWRTEPSLTIPRDYATGAVLDGKFYVIGGDNLAYEPPYIRQVERFDPATSTWSNAAMVPIAASKMAAASVDGHIYVAGGWTVRQGFTLSLMQIYDVATNTWTQGRLLPGPRSGAAAAAYNGKVYVIGGADASSSTNTVYEYDPATDTYTTKASMPTVQSSMAAVTLGDRIYVIGGYDSVHYAYDPVANTWSTIAAPPIPTGFMWNGAFALNGEIWVEGGYDNGTRRGYPPDRQIQIYNPATNSWRYGPHFNAPRTRSRAAGVIDGRGYVATGADLNDDHIYLTSLESIAYGSCPGGTATATPVASGTRTPAPLTSTPSATNAATNPPSSTPVGTTHTPTVPPGATLTPTSPPVGTVTTTPTSCPMTFTDVQPSDYFYVPVQYLYCTGVISGYADNTFRPYNNTTRGQLTKIVVLAEGWPIYTPPTPTFNDVPQTHPFYTYVETAYRHGVISGYSNGAFRPGDNITRGQLCKVVVLAEGWTLYLPPAPTFSDVQEGNPFYIYVETAYSHSIISGYGDQTFRPGNPATRGQIAKIVYSALQSPRRR
jgi:hypothetical protein